jgi:hypothetical protein
VVLGGVNVKNGRAVNQSGVGVRLCPPIRRLLNRHLWEIGVAKLEFSKAVQAIDSLLYRYNYHVEEWPEFIGSELFRFTLPLFYCWDEKTQSAIGLYDLVVNSVLVVDGYMGKLEVAYLS